ncbi:MAG: hypothetical protein WC384_00680 [Prolixibacteraceae bacterium]|jgi:hypothetical protein
MKKSIFLIVVGLFCSVTLFSQNNIDTETHTDSILSVQVEPTPNYDITIGFAPRLPFNALKTSFSANNIFFKRVGLYATLEKGLDTNYFAGALGVTTSIHKYVYLWGGIGIFPYNDSKNSSFWSRFRKEFGVGFTPYKMTVVRLGWSLTVGPSIAAGIKIPIKSKHKLKNK